MLESLSVGPDYVASLIADITGLMSAGFQFSAAGNSDRAYEHSLGCYLYQPPQQVGLFQKISMI